MASHPSAPTRPRLKPILMPAEHGGWSFIGAPIILGLAMAPSWIGLLISIAGLLMFLSRQPLKTGTKDLIQKKMFPRTAWALGFGGLELTVALILVAVAVYLSGSHVVVPTALFFAVAAVQFAFDSFGKGRNTLPEIIGASAAALLATVIALAGGLPEKPAWLLAGFLALHSALAIVYVGVRLDLAHQRPTSVSAVWFVSLVAFALVAAAVLNGLARWPVLGGFAILAARAAWGVSPRRAMVKPHWIGIQEICYTLMLIFLVALSL